MSRVPKYTIEKKSEILEAYENGYVTMILVLFYLLGAIPLIRSSVHWAV